MLVSTPDVAALGDALTRAGARVSHDGHGCLTVSNLSTEAIALLARDVGALVTGMRSQDADLEATFAALIERKDALS